MQADAQFNQAKISSSKTKFDHVISILPPEVISEVRDIVVSAPSSEDPYTALKDALIHRIAATERERLKQLVSGEEIGDRKPSQLLRQMQQLLGSKVSSFDKSLFRELFLQKLPTRMQGVLAIMGEDVPVEKLAEAADRMADVESPSFSSIQAIASLQEQISALTLEINELRASRSNQNKYPYRNRRRSKSRDNKNQSFCYFHRRFGSKARKCVSPCNYQGNQ